MFRFNRRSSKARGLLFYRLLEGAIAAGPAPFTAIKGGKPETDRAYDSDLITNVTKVRLASPTCPVTSQQPSVGKKTPLA